MKAKSGAATKPSKAPSKSVFKRSFWTVWLSAAGVISLLFLLAAKFPRFPFDLQLTRALQRVDPTHHAWAKWLTETAKVPIVYVLVGFAALVGWRLVGWRSVILAPTAWLMSLGADRLLKPWISRSRPSSSLVEVVGSAAPFGCPSTFALVYATTIGLVAWLLGRSGKGRSRWLGLLGCTIVLLAGGVARVVLGAHWPSDVLLSFALGGLLVSGLCRVILRK